MPKVSYLESGKGRTHTKASPRVQEAGHIMVNNECVNAPVPDFFPLS